EKLGQCRDALQEWEATHFGNVNHQLRICRKELETLQQTLPRAVIRHREMEEKIKELPSSRQKRNFIKKIISASGEFLTSEKSIEEAFCEYFGELFTPKTDIDMHEALEAVEPKVTPEMNNMLKLPSTKE
ncbi:hypothetical protein C2S52_008620, partial [Perilla frutescens var. hirtella]